MKGWKLKTKLVLLLISIATVSLLQACSKPPSLNFIPHDGLVLAFGDSLTVGVGASDGADYPAVLSELCYRRVINAGVSGEITWLQGKARMATKFLSTLGRPGEHKRPRPIVPTPR